MRLRLQALRRIRLKRLMQNNSAETGMEMMDLLTNSGFAERGIQHRNANRESVALRKLSRLLVESRESVLQELVDTAVDSCGADSAGISLEEPANGTFRWIVVSGSFAPYLNGRTPRDYSPCGTCLDSGRPQLYRVTKPYYDFLGVAADPITDGLLIPWKNEFFKGTLWAVSHAPGEAFDKSDYDLLSSLADFASIVVREQHQQQLLQEIERTKGLTDMAHRMAHRINNPLQSLTNTLFLARQGHEEDVFLKQAESELGQLSKQVSLLLKTTGNYGSTETTE